MDSLYDDLENYEDVNIIQDLKTENKELKMKLEKYTNCLNELQADFDKLTSEYKILERNYSSLLKTARAEIERKSCMITQLNQEKDMFVIKSFQTKGTRYFNNIPHNKIRHNSSGLQHEKENKLIKKEKLSVEEVSNRDKSDKDHIPHSTEIKENKDTRHKKSQSVTDQKTSMPVVRSPEFSSEDENEKYHSGKEKRSKDSKSNKMSETSSIDDKHSNYNKSPQHSRQKRSRHSRRYYDKNTSRGRSWHRTNRSPEVTSKDTFSENYHHYHHRSRSPPSDRRSHHKSHDRKPLPYNTETSHNDNYATHGNKQHIYKHKLEPHSDEPNNKKIRVESYGEYITCKEKDTVVEESVDPTPTLKSPVDHFRTCQSPDHGVIVDCNDDQSLVKEIVSVTATPQEDPRVVSKKYILQTDNGKVVLKTISRNEVYLKLVDKSMWLEPDVIVTSPLMNKPPLVQTNEDLCTEIYSNIDNFELDISQESLEDDNLFPKSDNCSDRNTKNVQVTKQIFEDKDEDIMLSMNNSEDEIKTSKEAETNINTNEKQLKNEESSQGTYLPKNSTIKSYNAINIKVLNLPNISDDIQALRDEIDKETHSYSTPNYKSHKYEVGDCIGTVEGDLLLSDDASDIMDVSKQTVFEEEPCKENTSLKIKIKHCKIDIPIDNNSYSNENAKSNSVNDIYVKNKSNSGNNITKKDNVDDNASEIKDKSCFDTSYNIPVDSVCEKGSNSHTADKISFENVKLQPGESTTAVQPIAAEANVSKCVNTNIVVKIACEERDTQSNNTKEADIPPEGSFDHKNEVSTPETNQNNSHNKVMIECDKSETVDVVPVENRDKPSRESKFDKDEILHKEKDESGNKISPVNSLTCVIKDSKSTKANNSHLKVDTSCEVDEDKANSNRNFEETSSLMIKNSHVERENHNNGIDTTKFSLEDDLLHESKGESAKNEHEKDFNVSEKVSGKRKEKPNRKSKSGKNEISGQVKYKFSSECRSNESHSAIGTICNANIEQSEKPKTAIPTSRDANDEKSTEMNKEKPWKNKNHKTNKKSSETRVQSKDTTTKKVKTNKGHGIKTKFSVLFDDSNSLIMPEDLGINKKAELINKVSLVSDDTQNAVDLSEHTRNNEITTENDEHSPNTNIEKKLTSLDEEAASISEQNSVVVSNLENSNLYENLNAAVSLNGSNVVIISSGVQPSCLTVKEGEVDQVIDNLTPNSLPALKALATSTPFKVADSFTFNSEDVQNKPENGSSNLGSNSTEQTAADVPDVRIFVKRRRKLKKP